jgi:hypothetical protein
MIASTSRPAFEALKPNTCRSWGYTQFRSAMICADMIDAAYARDAAWMRSSTMCLREFIVRRWTSCSKSIST